MNNLKALVDGIANQADELLAGCTSRFDANTTILEYLTAKHRNMSLADRRTVAAQVLAILQNEGFFESGPADAWDSDDGDEAAEE